MGQQSTIEWTDHTFNPWWGCVKVSKGCTHCYAETWANRYGHDVWGIRKDRRIFSEEHWKQPLKWNAIAQKNNHRERVFCASMADVFEDNTSIEVERKKLWTLIEQTSMLDWLLLTKRPENMLNFAPWKKQWPRNVWAMTSVEDQEQAEKRIPALLKVPAIVRGLSVEPLLGPVDLGCWLNQIQWVIVGGESGRDSRPMHPAWVHRLQKQCVDASVPFFFKQWGNWIVSEPKTGICSRLTGGCLGARMPSTGTCSGPEEGSLWEPVPSVVEGIRVQIEPGFDNRQDCFMKRISKKNAGRLLDGKEWNEIPQ